MRKKSKLKKAIGAKSVGSTGKYAKGGSASKVIGTTSKGKKIYDQFDHKSHSKFIRNEHSEAALLHSKLQSRALHDADQPEFNKDEMERIARHHGAQFDKHLEASRKEFESGGQPTGRGKFHRDQKGLWHPREEGKMIHMPDVAVPGFVKLMLEIASKFELNSGSKISTSKRFPIFEREISKAYKLYFGWQPTFSNADRKAVLLNAVTELVPEPQKSLLKNAINDGVTLKYYDAKNKVHDFDIPEKKLSSGGKPLGSSGMFAKGGFNAGIGEARAKKIAKSIVEYGEEAGMNLPGLTSFIKNGVTAENFPDIRSDLQKVNTSGGFKVPYEDSSRLKKFFAEKSNDNMKTQSKIRKALGGKPLGSSGLFEKGGKPLGSSGLFAEGGKPKGSSGLFEDGGKPLGSSGLFENGGKPKGSTGKFARGGSADESPKIYVADLAAYNEGKLIGEWLDLNDYSSGSEVMDAITELLAKWSEEQDEQREEYAIHDTENIPSNLVSEYMGESTFDKIIEIKKAAEDAGIPVEVVTQWMGDVGHDDPSDVSDAFQGEYDDEEDYAYRMVEEGVISDLSQYIMIDDTTRRVLADEESDARVDNDADEDDWLREADMQDEVDELDSDADDYDEKREAIVEKAKEHVRSEEYERIYKALEDPIQYFVEDTGTYTEEELAKASFVSIDYEHLARELGYDVTYVNHDGKTYVFSSNFKRGGKLHQTETKGRTGKAIRDDKSVKARKPGFRVSSEGNRYYEGRANRTDVDRKARFEDGGQTTDSYASGGPAKVANASAKEYSENHLPFRASNLEGKVLDNGDYVVLSYGYYPIWFYSTKEGKWYLNSDKYSKTTAIHISQSRPTYDAVPLTNNELLEKMRQEEAHFDLGGIMVQTLYPMSTDNTLIAHGGGMNTGIKTGQQS